MSNKSAKIEKREKYTEIYDKYYPLIFNTVFSKVGNKFDTNDICQEIFIIFYEKFEDVENYRKWLFGTLRNVILRYYEKKSKKESDADIDLTFDDVGLTYVNGYKDTRIIIQDAIDNINITEEEKLMLDYIAFNNYSYSNVGKIMGLSKRQVGYTYLAVVKRILLYLRENGITNIEDLL